MLLVGALALCVAVLVVAPPINGARRWFLRRADQRAAVRAREDRRLHLGLRAPRAAPDAAHDGRADEAARHRRRPLLASSILLEPDLGTTIALCIMVAGILLVSEVPFRLLALAGSIALVLGAAAIYMEPYRRARFLSFLDPWQDPQGAGFQTVQAIIGMGSGGITGEGLGQGISKIFYLPEAHTDMIFAIVGEELGLIGSTARDRGVRRLRVGRLPDRARSAAIRSASGSPPGITTLVCGQAAVNLCAVLGIAPLTGIPLPFVSYGGSSLIVLLAAVGVLLNIAVNDRVVEARSRDRSGRDRRSHQARARSRGSAARARSDRDVRRQSRPRRVAAGS